MTPQERERFEEWHFVEFGWHPTVPEGGTDYLDVAVRKLWKAWQARAALDAGADEVREALRVIDKRLTKIGLSAEELAAFGVVTAAALANPESAPEGAK